MSLLCRIATLSLVATLTNCRKPSSVLSTVLIIIFFFFTVNDAYGTEAQLFSFPTYELFSLIRILPWVYHVKIWFIWKLIRLVVMVDPALSWKICFIRIRIRQALKHYLPCECLLCLVCLHLLPVVPLLVKLTTNRVIITPRGATKPSIIKKSLILQIFFKIQKHHFQINGKVGQLKKRKRVLCWSIYIYILLVPDNNTTIICFVPL